jgi:hypothetical protein
MGGVESGSSNLCGQKSTVPPAVPDVGFFRRNVGSLSGNFKKPDINLPNRISSLGVKCRVCQVFYREREHQRILGGAGGEKPGVWVWTPNGLQDALKTDCSGCKSMRNSGRAAGI